MLTPDDFNGASNGTQLRSFFDRIHERLGAGGDIGSEDLSADTTGIKAGQQNLQANSGRLGAGDQAADFAADVSAGQRAIGAPAGSIAARSNPFQYGSVASRQFSDTFQPGGLDNLNNQIDQADPDQRQGLQRRAVGTYQSAILGANQNG